MAESRTCARCAHPIPELLTDGICPSCGSVVGNGSTPKLDETPADRDDDFEYSQNSKTGTYRSFVPLPTTIIAEKIRTLPPKRWTVPVIENYTDLDLIGHGGMGYVYRATQVGTSRTVAIKVMMNGRLPNNQNRERFMNEVKALGRIGHAGIVEVYEVNECDSGPFYTMEYVAGETLAQRVRKNGPLPPEEATEIMAQVSDAVHAAHVAGVLHRDIKPSNILISHENVVKVADFGLAKHADDHDDLTATGMVVGTPSYMAREQAMGDKKRIGLGTDVYGLGATLHFLLTGQPPYRAATPMEVLQKMDVEPSPAPRNHAPNLCPVLDAIVQKCLRLEPSARYETAAQLAGDLRNWTERKPTIAKPLTLIGRLLSSTRRYRVAIGLVALVFLIVAAAIVAKREMDPKRRIDRALARGDAVTLIGETGMPKWYDWKLGESILKDSQIFDGTIGFQSQRLSLLCLVDDPQTDHYRFTAEVRQMTMDSGTPQAKLPVDSNPRIGIFWGLDQVATQNGTKQHTAFTIEINEFQRKVNSAKIYKHLRTEGHRVGEVPIAMTLSHTAPTYIPRTIEVPPGPWRTVILEVQPTGFTVFIVSPGETPLQLVNLNRDEIEVMIDIQRKTLDKSYSPDVFPLSTWSPRRPLGIFGLSGILAVRNVRIEPLP